MTLVAAWVRNVGETEELVIATDSRLTGGHTWDVGPKIAPLRRGDCALCFAGSTVYAYPLIQHVQNYVEMYDRARTRALDLADFKGHVLRVIEALVDQIEQPVTIPQKDFTLILAGYSWRHASFKIWSLQYIRQTKRLVFQAATSHAKRTRGTKKFWFIGDNYRSARNKLYSILQDRQKLTVGGLDMEPFEVLVNFIRDSRYSSIGGPPQVLKVYRHLNTMALNVYWPDAASKTVTYLGRPLLSYEKNRNLVLDPDTLEVTPVPAAISTT